VYNLYVQRSWQIRRVNLTCSVCAEEFQWHSVTTFITSPREECEVLRWACLDVCLSVRLLFVCISQKPQVQTSWNFIYVLPVAVARSSSDHSAILYVLPVLWTTPYLPINGPHGAWLRGCILKVTHQWAERGAKSWCLRLPCCNCELRKWSWLPDVTRYACTIK